MSTTTQSRQPAGTPIGGQYAEMRRAHADGVELVDPGACGESGQQEVTPLNISESDVISALRDDHDVLGLGAAFQAATGDVHVYYASDDSAPVGIAATSDDTVQLYGFDDDDRDFARPRLLSTEELSLQEGRQRAATRLGVNLDASRLLAVLPRMTEAQKELLANAYEEANAGAREDAVREATKAVEDASYDGQVPTMTNIDHGQKAAAFSTHNDEDHRVRAAVLDALWALQRRDLVNDPRVSGQHVGRAYGWTQRAYDQMTGPVREVLGPIHAGDTPVERLRPGFEDDVISRASTNPHPYVRGLAADTAQAVLADRLEGLGVTGYSLYHHDGQVRVGQLDIAGNPDPDENYALYDEARELVERYAEKHMPLEALRGQLVSRGGPSAAQDGAAMSFDVADYAGDGVRAAIELRDVDRDERAKQATEARLAS